MNGRPALTTAAKILAAVAILAAIALISSSFSGLLAGLAATAAVLLILSAIVAALGIRFAGWDPVSEDDFEDVVRRTERLAASGLYVDPDETEFMQLDPWLDEHFEEIVADALDDLPDILRGALRNLAIVVTDGGIKAGAYGMYQGDTVAGDHHARVLIFRDSLRRDFGHDADLLQEQITITVRHELAHHLGADELGVRDLGLE